MCCCVTVIAVYLKLDKPLWERLTWIQDGKWPSKNEAKSIVSRFNEETAEAKKKSKKDNKKNGSNNENSNNNNGKNEIDSDMDNDEASVGGSDDDIDIVTRYVFHHLSLRFISHC